MGEYRTVAVVVFVGVMTSLGFSLLVRELEKDRFEAEFSRECSSLTAALQQAAETNLKELRNLASFYLASKQVERGEFEAYVGGMLARNETIRALEWVPRVLAADRTAFEATLGNGRGVPARIMEADPEGRLRPAGDRPEYYPVFFVEPKEPNLAALGFDLASEPLRAHALKRAMETGLQTATAPVNLVQGTADREGFLVVNPIYGKNGQAGPLMRRPHELVGFVAGVFIIWELADSVFRDQLPAWTSVTIRDVTEPEASLEAFARRGAGTGMPALVSESHIEIAGRKWNLRFVPDRAYVVSQQTPPPWSILAAGLGMTGLLGMSLNRTIRNAKRIRAAENKMRDALSAKETALEEATLLGGITEKINAGHRIGEILDFVYTEFDSIIPYDRIGLALVEDGGKIVRSRWSRTRHGETLLGDGYCAPLEGSSLMKVFENGLPRIIGDLSSYAQMHPDSTSSHIIVEEGMRSSLTCPLVVQGKAVGFLFFSSVKPYSYKSDHVETFMRVARQLSVIVEKGQLFDALAEEEKRSEQILQSLLPGEILQRVKNGEKIIADEVPAASVVFADLVDFCDWSRHLASSDLITLLNRVFEKFDLLARSGGMVKIGTQGDSYLAVAGLPAPRVNHVRLAAEYALALQQAIAKFHGPTRRPLALRIGIHTGPVVAGVLGKWAWRYDVWGRTVNLASRMESESAPGRIQVSKEAADHLRQHYRLTKREPIQAKGFGTIETYWLDGRLEEARAPLSALEAS